MESQTGKTFKKSASLITFFNLDGTKKMLGADAVLRASTIGAKTFLFLTEKKQTSLLTLTRGESWKVVAEPTLFQGPTVMVKLPAIGGRKSRYIAFSSRGSRVIGEASSLGSLERFKDEGDVLLARRSRFDAQNLTPLYADIVPQGILLVYSAKNVEGKLSIGAALFDKKKPKMLLWRSDEALWTESGRSVRERVVLGGLNRGKYFYIYTQTSGQAVEMFPVARYWEAVDQSKRRDFVLPPRKKGVVIPLERLASNPVIEPIARHSWEAFATFNPAALVLDNRVHLLYRAQGYDGLSVLGYASSGDGLSIDERSAEPAFVPREAKETNNQSLYPYVSGGGTGGCEDPRLVEIDGMVYLIYIAFDGAHPPGVALTHITKRDFLAKRFRWSRPRLISQPGKIQKNWVLFPEKINGRYAILHGISPKIRIEYVDDPKRLGDGTYIESLSSHGGGGYIEATRLGAWDNIVRGVGAPPLRTKYGWLVFYHGMDMRDPGKYKVGVMLLDLKNPERILHRAVEPVLEPETDYENSGHKRGVIYVCGAVIKDGKLLVYYGASDRITAVAMAQLETFLESLRKDMPPKLQKMNLKKVR